MTDRFKNIALIGMSITALALGGLGNRRRSLRGREQH